MRQLGSMQLSSEASCAFRLAWAAVLNEATVPEMVSVVLITVLDTETTPMLEPRGENGG